MLCGIVLVAICCGSGLLKVQIVYDFVCLLWLLFCGCLVLNFLVLLLGFLCGVEFLMDLLLVL